MHQEHSNATKCRISSAASGLSAMALTAAVQQLAAETRRVEPRAVTDDARPAHAAPSTWTCSDCGRVRRRHQFDEISEDTGGGRAVRRVCRDGCDPM